MMLLTIAHLSTTALAQPVTITGNRPVYEYVERLRKHAETPIAYEDAIYAPQGAKSITCPAIKTLSTADLMAALEACVAFENATRTCGILAVDLNDDQIRVHAVDGIANDGSCGEISEHPLDAVPAPIGKYVDRFGLVRVEDGNLMETVPAAGPWRPRIEQARMRKPQTKALTGRTRQRDGEWTYSLSLQPVVVKPLLNEEEEMLRHDRIEAAREQVQLDFQEWLDAGQPAGPVGSEWPSPE